MSRKRKSRSTADRIRYAISFEVIGIVLSTPLGAWAFGLPVFEVGVVGVTGATIATVWNYLFNLAFDYALLAHTGNPTKSFVARIAHAVLFEVGLIMVLLPIIAWYLSISLLEVFLMDVGFAAFYMIYAFVFDLAYCSFYPQPSTDQS
jgi:uncharacterized membrane protein